MTQSSTEEFRIDGEFDGQKQRWTRSTFDGAKGLAQHLFTKGYRKIEVRNTLGGTVGDVLFRPLEITGTHEVKELSNGSAQLTISVFINEQKVHDFVAYSGPKQDLDDYLEGRCTSEEISKRWEKSLKVTMRKR